MSLELLLQKATVIEEKMEKFSEETKEFASFKSQLENLQREIVALREKGAELPNEHIFKTLGEQIVESKQYKNFLAGLQPSASIQLENTLANIHTPQGFVAPHRKEEIVGAPELPNVVLNSFPIVPTESDAVQYLREKKFTNNAAAYKPGSGSLAESNWEGEQVITNIIDIGHFIRITDQLAKDTNALKTYLQARLLYGLHRAVEKQLLNGTGAGNQLEGIFKTENYVAHGLTTESFEGQATNLDVIRRCATSIRALGYLPNHVFLNPVDYDKIISTKDANGSYILANPTQSYDGTKPWGLTAVVSPEVTENNFMVADTLNGATIYLRQEPIVEASIHDSDNFVKKLVTIRVTTRLAIAIESPNCFVGGTFPDLTPAALVGRAKVGSAKVA